MNTLKIHDESDLRFSTPFTLDFAISCYQANAIECEQAEAELAEKKAYQAELDTTEKSAIAARTDADFVFASIQRLSAQVDGLFALHNQAIEDARKSLDVIPQAARAGDRAEVINLARALNTQTQLQTDLQKKARALQEEMARLLSIRVGSWGPFHTKELEREAGSRRAQAVQAAGKAKAGREACESILRDMYKPLREAKQRLANAHEAVVLSALKEVSDEDAKLNQ